MDIKSELNQLPIPTGLYQVGIKTVDLVDETRLEPLYPKGRLVPIWIYFPTHKGSQIPHTMILEERALDNWDMFHTWKKLNVKGFSEKEENLESLKNTGKHPLVFLNHGDGFYLSDLAHIAEDLASHGYVVIAIQHQLKRDQKPALKKYVHVIDNMCFVFDWLKKNQDKAFFGSLDLDRVGSIGFSMGGNANVLFAATGNYGNLADTLFPHETEDAKECLIAIDPQCFPFPLSNRIPTFLLFTEQREHEQKSSGELDLMKRLGHQVIYYPHTHHRSFLTASYLNVQSSSSPRQGWYGGTTEEKLKFFDKVRSDIRAFLQKNL